MLFHVLIIISCLKGGDLRISDLSEPEPAEATQATLSTEYQLRSTSLTRHKGDLHHSLRASSRKEAPHHSTSIFWDMKDSHHSTHASRYKENPHRSTITQPRMLPLYHQPTSYGRSMFRLENGDVKVYRLGNKELMTKQQGETLCESYNEENGDNSDGLNHAYFYTLLSVLDQQEQNFLQKFLFDVNGIKENVWLGLKESNGILRWNGKNELVFTNWAEKREPNAALQEPDVTLECVQMDFGYSEKAGLWSKVDCAKKNIVVCEAFTTEQPAALRNQFLKNKRQMRRQWQRAANEIQDLNKNIKEEHNRINTVNPNVTDVGDLNDQAGSDQNRKKNTLKRQRRFLADNNDVLKQSFRNLQKKIVGVLIDNQETGRSIAELTQNIGKLTIERKLMETMISGLQKEISFLKIRNNNPEQSNSDLTQTVKDLIQNVSDLSKRLEAAEKMIDDLEWIVLHHWFQTSSLNTPSLQPCRKFDEEEIMDISSKTTKKVGNEIFLSKRHHDLDENDEMVNQSGNATALEGYEFIHNVLTKRISGGTFLPKLNNSDEHYEVMNTTGNTTAFEDNKLSTNLNTKIKGRKLALPRHHHLKYNGKLLNSSCDIIEQKMGELGLNLKHLQRTVIDLQLKNNASEQKNLNLEKVIMELKISNELAERENVVLKQSVRDIERQIQAIRSILKLDSIVEPKLRDQQQEPVHLTSRRIGESDSRESSLEVNNEDEKKDTNVFKDTTTVPQQQLIHSNFNIVLSDDKLSFEEASKSCRKKYKGNLLVILDQEMQNRATEILDKIEDYEPVWIGLNGVISGKVHKPDDPKTNYLMHWANGLTFNVHSFSSFVKDHPDIRGHACVHMDKIDMSDERYGWAATEDCGLLFRYFCQVICS